MKGRFDAAEDAYLRNNHRTMTDAEIASALSRTKPSIAGRRRVLGLKGNRRKPRKATYPGKTEDEAGRRLWEEACRRSRNFRGIVSTLSKDEELAYVENWIDWHSEEIQFTAMEEDLVHYSILAQLRIIRLLKEERESIDWATAERKKGNLSAMPVSRMREIKEQFAIVAKNHESLNVERRQRLKNRQEAGSRFIDIVKASKEAGAEPAMLKCLKWKRMK